MFSKVPLTPVPVRIPWALVRFCCESALENSVAKFADDVFELLVDDALFDDPVVVPDVVLDGVVGCAELFLVPKPIAAASVPLPTTAIESLLFLLVMIRRPLLLSDAVTCALVGRSTLMALIRSPIVSVPVDV